MEMVYLQSKKILQYLQTVLKLLAPITPFISDKIWTILYSSSSIHAERQVESTGAKYDQSTRNAITDFTATVWAKKKDAGLSLKDEIRIKVPDSLAANQTLYRCIILLNDKVD